jgi:hypothetical protein
VPYRPNRGVYVVVERPGGDDPTWQWNDDEVERLLAIDGVAGLWTFATNAALRPDRFDQTHYGVAFCYLDGDPVTTAGPVGELLAARRDRASVTPEFAAPFVTMRAWEWNRFGRPG